MGIGLNRNEDGKRDEDGDRGGDVAHMGWEQCRACRFAGTKCCRWDAKCGHCFSVHVPTPGTAPPRQRVPSAHSELILSNIHVSANGEWECAVSTSQGNVSKKVEIVVLETSASYCPAERVTNNRGDFR